MEKIQVKMLVKNNLERKHFSKKSLKIFKKLFQWKIKLKYSLKLKFFKCNDRIKFIYLFLKFLKI